MYVGPCRNLSFSEFSVSLHVCVHDVNFMLLEEKRVVVDLYISVSADMIVCTGSLCKAIVQEVGG